MSKQAPAQTKYTNYLRKRYPNLNSKDISQLLSDTKRFVTVVQKIYTEPQAQISYRDIEIKGKKVKQKIITTDLKEVMKVADKSKKQHGISDLLSKFHKQVTKKI